MSHFSVLVIGENIEEQLAPFHEFECTGENDQYIQDVDITAEVRERMVAKDGEDADSLTDALAWHGLDEKQIDDESKIDKEGAHKFGYAIVRNGELIKAINRTNPNAKWDWWVLGGRWGGFFYPKKNVGGFVLGEPSTFDKLDGDSRDHSKADQILKRDVDFDRMRQTAACDAGNKYDTMVRLMGGEIRPLEYRWENILEDETFKDLTMEKRRELYWAQPPLVKFQSLRSGKDLSEKEKDLVIRGNYEEFLVSREDYVARARRKSIMTFAVLKDGVWYERGSMGWWGCVSDEKNEDEWATQFEALLNGLPDDTLLSVVDCHI